MAIVGVVVVLGCQLARAGEVARIAMPLTLQAALFKKIFYYDSVLAAAANDDTLRVLVAFGQSDEREAQAVVAAFAKLAVRADAVRDTEVADQLTASTVVYLMPGTDADALAQLCEQRHILAVTAHSQYVEAGQTAVGVTLTPDGYPLIMVHLHALKRTGHELHPHLLKLARVLG